MASGFQLLKLSPVRCSACTEREERDIVPSESSWFKDSERKLISVTFSVHTHLYLYSLIYYIYILYDLYFEIVPCISKIKCLFSFFNFIVVQFQLSAFSPCPSLPCFHPPPWFASLEKCLFKSFAHFFNWVVCLPGGELCEFFIYFGDQTLVWGIIGKYVFPYSWFSFHFNAVFFSHAGAICLFFPLCPLLEGTCLWRCCCVEWLRFSCQCFPLGLLWYYDLYLSLLPTLNLFLCMV